MSKNKEYIRVVSYFLSFNKKKTVCKERILYAIQSANRDIIINSN